MDPLSIAFGIAGLMPLVANAIKLARNYWTAVRGAEDKVTTLVTELEALQYNLNALQSLMNNNGPGPEHVARDHSSVLLSCSTACRVKLQALVQKLERPGLAKGKMRALLWPLQEKEHKEAISDLRSLTAWMQFSLSIGGYRLLSSSSSEVLELLRRQLSDFEEIKKNQIGLRQGLGQQQELSKDSGRERQDLLNWVSHLNVYAQHEKIQAARTDNTGLWFLQDEIFIGWRNALAGPRLLWCHGPPGSGKTVLSSLVVDELLKEGNSCPVAFFYFNYREADQQDPRAVLSCLLRQVTAALDDIPLELLQMKLNKGDSARLSLDECKQMMSICLAKTACVHFILDGLDECDVSRHRKTILETLHGLAQLPQTRVLVTSRSHTQDISRSFHEIPQMNIMAHDEDLEKYMLAELDTSCGSDFLDEDMTTRICDQIKRRANGMFLLAVLQLRSIVNEPTPGEMEDALERMSGDLMGAFEETISRIRNLPRSRAQLAMGVLMWLCHAKRVMSTAEISDALAFRKSRGSTLSKYRPSLNMILECCHGLVVLSAETGYIELAHYSIQEYLQNRTPGLFPIVEQWMASTCLGYLMLEDFGRGPACIDIEVDDGLIEERVRDFPFVSYAARFWDEHVRNIQSNQSIWPLLFNFVNHNRAMACSIQIRRFEANFKWMYYDPRECLSRTPIHNANDFGLETLLPMMMKDPNFSSSINSRTELVGSTPIILAASSGHVGLVKLLLQQGADPFISNWYGSALHCAAEADQPDTIAALVGFGMNPNDCEQYWTHRSPNAPISCTLDRDSVSALNALVSLGASVNVDDDGVEQHFLHEAAQGGASRIVEYLVRNGLVDVNSKSHTGQTALDCAIDSQETETIRMLLNIGADPGQISSESSAFLATLGLGLAI